MKNYTFILTSALALYLCGSATIVAQMSPYAGGTPGMFGYRTLGGPFIGGQTSGMFGNRTIGQPFFSGQTQSMFGYRRISQPLTPQLNLYGVEIQTYPSWNISQFGPPNVSPGALATQTPESPALDYNLPENTATPESAPASLPETTGSEGINLAEQNPSITPAITPGAGPQAQPAASNVTLPRGRISMESVSSTRGQSFVRSRELSDRLTLIARDKGMISGEGINVYLSNDIALLQGKVRSSADRILLANVLSLSPGVRQIDNRLAVEGPGVISSNGNGR